MHWYLKPCQRPPRKSSSFPFSFATNFANLTARPIMMIPKRTPSIIHPYNQNQNHNQNHNQKQQQQQQHRLSIAAPPAMIMTPLSISSLLSIAFSYGCIMTTLFLLVLPIECQRIESESKFYDHSHTPTIRKSVSSQFRYYSRCTSEDWYIHQSPGTFTHA